MDEYSAKLLAHACYLCLCALSLARRQIELRGVHKRSAVGASALPPCPVHAATEEPGAALRGVRCAARAVDGAARSAGGELVSMRRATIFALFESDKMSVIHPS